MANGMLDQTGEACQSSERIFTLRFTREKWCQFWQLLIIGTEMADCLRNHSGITSAFRYAEDPFKQYAVEKWDELSHSLLHILTDCEVSDDASIEEGSS